MSVHLVMGGSGYFGSILVDDLVNQGYKVKIFDINKPEYIRNGVDFFQGDVRNKFSVSKALKGVEVVYNTIAQVPLAKNKRLFISVNVSGSKIIYEESLKAGVRSIVYVSSSAIFGIPKNNPVQISDVPRPMEDYGKAKYAAELMGMHYSKLGLNISVIRPRTILGHGRLGIFSILFDWVKRGINLPVLGYGENRYQFIHVKDLSNACILSSNKEGYNVYNIGASKFGTMRELLRDLIIHSESKSEIVQVPLFFAEKIMELTSLLGLSPLGPYHSMMYGREMFFDISDSVENLNWTPTYSNKQMICESFDWYLDNFKDLNSKDHNKSMHQKVINKKVLKLWELIS